MEIYLVGGAVRDTLLQVKARDRDWVVVGATPQQMIDGGYRPVGQEFPVFLHPDTNEEYALARTERKSGHGYHGFTFYTDPSVTLEQDLARRDLTINAMAMDSEGQLYDPYGGQKDLEQGRLRHVSAAFAEDPVRILRIARYAARFAKWGFRVAHSTHQLMRQMVASGEVDHLVPERVWQEFESALLEDDPGRFIEVLHRCGALDRIMPELAQLFGVPQPEHHHPEIDTGVHTLMVLRQAVALSPLAEVRFAALVHDLGKGTTPRQEWPRHIGHEVRGVGLVEQLCQRLKAPKRFRELAVVVTRYHTHYHRAVELRPATLLKLFHGLDLFRRPERLGYFLAVGEADSRGRLGFEGGEYPQRLLIQRTFEAAITITGSQVASDGYRGVAVGEEMERRRLAAIAAVTGN